MIGYTLIAFGENPLLLVDIGDSIVLSPEVLFPS